MSPAGKPEGTGRAAGRWLVYALLLVPAGAGTALALLSAAFSVMAFDSPKADQQVWPYVVGMGAPLLAIALVALILRSGKLMKAGRAEAACLSLAPAVLFAGGFFYWVRS